MNYLAHLFLSRDYPDAVIGNFLADMMTASEINLHADILYLGVRFHRKIDSFTDRHEVNRAMKRTLRPYFHKYAGVALDLYYDYILYQQWDRYSENDFRSFAQQQYTQIESQMAVVPERLRSRINNMVTGDFLYRYTTIEGQLFAFSKMIQRARFQTGFENAVDVLKLHEQELSEHFNQFFPDMIAETKKVKAQR